MLKYPFFLKCKQFPKVRIHRLKQNKHLLKEYGSLTVLHANNLNKDHTSVGALNIYCEWLSASV